jgi:hypothetical protein
MSSTRALFRQEKDQIGNSQKANSDSFFDSFGRDEKKMPSRVFPRPFHEIDQPCQVTL